MKILSFLLLAAGPALAQNVALPPQVSAQAQKAFEAAANSPEFGKVMQGVKSAGGSFYSDAVTALRNIGIQYRGPSDATVVVRFDNAVGVAQRSPSVLDANQKLSQAKTEEEKLAAIQNLKAALRKAIIEYDPTLVGMFDQLVPDVRK